MMTTSGRKRILLIGWDAADWRVINPLLDAGKLPALESLINRGVMGNLATIRPVLSPILWTSIATGKRAFKHGIHGFAEPTPDGGGIQPISNLSRKAKAFWNILHQNGMSGHVVGWWPSNPAEPIRGSMVSNLFQMVSSPDPHDPWPIRPGSVHPPRLTNQLAQLRFHPSELHENEIRPFIPFANEVDQETDCRMGICAKMLSECTTVHSVATYLAQYEPWDYMAVYYDAIDHFCHGFMKYHPPRQEHVSERDFRLYSQVVEAAYRYHDMMLATWLSLVGPETTIILLSDHGFHPDHMRLKHIPTEPAAPAAEHRELGILVIAGPGIKTDERLYGANLLDICPTLLTIAGLPVADDMDGVPLLQAWRSPPKVERIESWESAGDDCGQHPVDTKLDPRESQKAIEQLVQLGYIEKPAEDTQAAIQQVLRELNYNLAQSYMDADRHRDAADLLEQLHRDAPDDNRFAWRLALSYRALDEIEKLEPLVAEMKDVCVARSEKAMRELVELARQIMQRSALPQVDNDLDHESESRPVDQIAGSNGRSDESPIDLCRPPAPESSPLPADTAAAPALDSIEVEGNLQQSAERLTERLPLRRVIELASDQQRQKIHTLIAESRNNPYSFDYLQGYILLAKGEVEAALEYFHRAEQADPSRPWLPIQIGEAFLQLKKWEDAERSFRRALQSDNENAYAFAGLARSYLGRHMNREAAQAALNAVGILHHYAFAHYLLGIALHRLGKIERSVQALEMAVAINPNFAEAHRRLALIADRTFNDRSTANKHRRLARRGYGRLRKNRPNVLPKPIVGVASSDNTPADTRPGFSAVIENRWALRPDVDADSIVTIVTGLPRSGTSMMMQMLAAGGMPLLCDGLRQPDRNNPRGYFEFESAKRLQSDSSWLSAARGKAVKVVAQLLPNLPKGNYRLVFMDRDLDEVVHSQREMLRRSGAAEPTMSDDQLKNIFARQILMLAKILKRSRVPVLRVLHRQCVEEPATVAGELNRFLGGKLDATAMARAVEPNLYRQRSDSQLERINVTCASKSSVT